MRSRMSHQHSGYWNLAPVALRSSARLWPRSCATSSSVAVHLRNIASEIHKIHRRGTVESCNKKQHQSNHQRIPNRSTLKMRNVGQSPVMTKWPVLILRTCYNFNCLARGASRFWRLLGRDGNGGTWPHYGNCQASKTCQVTLILCDTMPYHARPSAHLRRLGLPGHAHGLHRCGCHKEPTDGIWEAPGIRRINAVSVWHKRRKWVWAHYAHFARRHYDGSSTSCGGHGQDIHSYPVLFHALPLSRLMFGKMIEAPSPFQVPDINPQKHNNHGANSNWTEQHRTTSNNLTISYNSFTAHSRSFVECRCALAANYSQIISLVGGTARSKKYHFWIRFKLSKKKQSYKLATGVK